MTFWLVLVALVAMTALSAFAVWRAWRDPRNWRVEPSTGQLVFNHWKEVALSAMVAGTMIALTLFWIA